MGSNEKGMKAPLLKRLDGYKIRTVAELMGEE